MVSLALAAASLLLLPSAVYRAERAKGANATSASFVSTADTFVKSAKPGGNYGQRSALEADAHPTVKRSLVRFQVTGIPDGASVVSATLRAFVVDYSRVGGEVRSVSGDWGEMTVTWQNAPVVGAKLSSLSVVPTGHWSAADVTAAVPGNGTAGFYITTTSADGVDYASRETANPPRLDITWSQPDGQLVTTSPTPTATDASSTATPPPAQPIDAMPTPAPTPVPTLAPSPTPAPGSAGTGSARIWKNANRAFDTYTADSSYADIINARYNGMLVYESYFDSRLSWYTQSAVFYKDAYAIYTDPARNKDGATDSWALRDAAGNPCYIPYSSPYDQFAADVGNQAFRDNWIAYVRMKLALFPGYEGIFIDDVNLDLTRVSCGGASGAGNNNSPIDPRTGAVMTNDNWRRYFAEFLEQIRAAIPGKTIVHNSIWYVTPFDDAYLIREIRAADVIQMEQGFIDSGLTGGTGKYSWSKKMDFVRLVHSLGAIVIDRDEGVTNAAQREYGLANYFLIAGGNDYYDPVYLSGPLDSWDVYGVNLGQAINSAYAWNGVWRRDFTSGFVLVNPPGSATATVNVAGYGSITLAERQGKVVVAAP